MEPKVIRKWKAINALTFCFTRNVNELQTEPTPQKPTSETKQTVKETEICYLPTEMQRRKTEANRIFISYVLLEVLLILVKRSLRLDNQRCDSRFLGTLRSYNILLTPHSRKSIVGLHILTNRN